MIFDILERRLLFRPRPVCDALPTDLGMDYEETWADTGDGRRLQCWHIPGDRRPELTWLWFGGTGGNLSLRVGEFAAVRQHTGANIFGFDYGGFGNSPGKASVQRTAVDARAARDHLQKRYGVAPERTLYLGVSMGSAVAIRLAAETTAPAGIALIAPFASLRDIAQLFYPRLTCGGRLVGDRYNSLKWVDRIGCPLLVLHGSDDKLVPVSQGRKLCQAAREPKTFAEITGAGHDDIGDYIEFWDTLGSWMDPIANLAA